MERQCLSMNSGHPPPNTQDPTPSSMCRWDKPKFAMVFASVLRSLRLLQSAKLAFGGRKFESTFKKDLRIVANATAADFERARAVLPAEGSVIGAFTSPQWKFAEH